MPLLSTVTHARLRAAQGDVRAARRILQELLAADPDQAEARELLAAWEGRGESPPLGEAEAAPPPPQPARPEALAARFREALGRRPGPPRAGTIARLAAWIDRVQRAQSR